ncbi:MAG: hypothetical protein ABMA02_09155 [Saprospiraceae bacterium]
MNYPIEFRSTLTIAQLENLSKRFEAINAGQGERRVPETGAGGVIVAIFEEALQNPFPRYVFSAQTLPSRPNHSITQSLHHSMPRGYCYI